MQAQDLGDPTRGFGGNTTRHSPASTGTSPHGRSRGGDSSSASTASAGIATLLRPVLARAGLSSSRILRIVTLHPSSAGSGACYNGDSSATQGFDGHVNADKGSRGVGAGCGTGGGGSIRAALSKDNGAFAPAVEVVVERFPLGVAEILRRAVLCGNRRLVAALSLCGRNSSDGGVGNVAGSSISCGNSAILSKRRQSSVGVGVGESRAGLIFVPGLRRPPVLCVGQSVGGKAVGSSDGDGGTGGRKVGGRPSRGDVGDGRGGDSTIKSSGEDATPQIVNTRSDYDHDDEDNSDDEHCSVVGAEPGLLLSSSNMLWALQPPFDVGSEDIRLLGNRGRASGVKGSASNSDKNIVSDKVSRRSNDTASKSTAGPEGIAGRTHVHHTMLAGERARVGGVGCPRREDLTRDVAWLSAGPVGSRLYYCLEEAEWEASQRQFSVLEKKAGCGISSSHKPSKGRKNSGPKSQPQEQHRVVEGVNVSGRRRVHSATGGVSCSTEVRAAMIGKASAGKGKEAGRSSESDEGSGEVASASKEEAAVLFARSVSEMLAETYLGPTGRRRSLGRSTLKSLAKEQEEDGIALKRSGMEASRRGSSAQGCRQWGTFIAGDFGAVGTSVAPSFIVSGTTHLHRRRPRSDVSESGGGNGVGTKEDRRRRCFDSLHVIPDVLISVLGGEGESKQNEEIKRAAKSLPPNSPEFLPGLPQPGGQGLSAGQSGDNQGSGDVDSIAATPMPTPKSPPLHFAPAGVLQLLGTQHCREFVEALPPAARARVFVLYEGFPDRTPPVGNLYAPLASHHGSLIPSSLGRRSRPERQSRVNAERMSDTAGNAIFTNRTKSDTFSFSALGQASPTTTPLLGALMQPLPVRAVRELLQVYLATTRAFGVVKVDGRGIGETEAAAVRHNRTSGLFAVPLQLPPPFRPTPPTLSGRNDDDGHGHDRNADAGVSESQLATKTGPDDGHEGVPDQEVSVEGRKLKGLSAEIAGADVGGVSYGDGGSGGGSGEEICGWFHVSATPPSAIDLLPDAPTLGGEARRGEASREDGRLPLSSSCSRPADATGGGDSATLTGKAEAIRRRRRPSSGSTIIDDNDYDVTDRCGTVVAKGISDNRNVPNLAEGCTTSHKKSTPKAKTKPKTPTQAGGQHTALPSPFPHGIPSPTVVAAVDGALTPGNNATIASSLRAPYRHAYVAVFAPQPLATVSAVANNGSARATAGGGGGSINKDPLLGATALFLQVEGLAAVDSPPLSSGPTVVSGGKESSVARVAAAFSGQGGEGGVIKMTPSAVFEKHYPARCGGGEGVVPPRVCGWRGCIADALCR